MTDARCTKSNCSIFPSTPVSSQRVRITLVAERLLLVINEHDSKFMSCRCDARPPRTWLELPTRLWVYRYVITAKVLRDAGGTS